jgi:hypothetical protein
LRRSSRAFEEVLEEAVDHLVGRLNVTALSQLLVHVLHPPFAKQGQKAAAPAGLQGCR